MDQNQKSEGGFTTAFSLGAVAGAAFAYFLQSDEGKRMRKELADEFIEVKNELVNQGLLPSKNMSGIEIITHFISHAAQFIEDADHKTEKKTPRKRQRTSPTLAKNSEKKQRQKFSGV